MIRFIIDTTISKRDTNGNCYAFHTITSTKTGNSLDVRAGWGSDNGNMKALLRKCGLEWEEFNSYERVLPILEWNQSERAHSAAVLEHEITESTVMELETVQEELQI